MKINVLLLSLMCFIATPCFSQNVVTKVETTASILPIFSKRHSGRSYDSERPISTDQIRLLAEAARSAPSSYNDQPWFFIFCNRATDPQAYAKVMKGLDEFNQGWAKNVPLLVVVVADTKSRHTQKENRWGPYDTGAAAVSMALQAAGMGLMAHQMGGFDEDIIRSEFQVPAQYVPMSVMAIGYETPAEAANIPAKTRQSLNENFFMGKWCKKLETE
jgi:nitroreductase